MITMVETNSADSSSGFLLPLLVGLASLAVGMLTISPMYELMKTNPADDPDNILAFFWLGLWVVLAVGVNSVIGRFRHTSNQETT
jgi:hypothetical protein